MSWIAEALVYLNLEARWREQLVDGAEKLSTLTPLNRSIDQLKLWSRAKVC